MLIMLVMLWMRTSRGQCRIEFSPCEVLYRWVASCSGCVLAVAIAELGFSPCEVLDLYHGRFCITVSHW